jgi:hypothetical protein
MVGDGLRGGGVAAFLKKKSHGAQGIEEQAVAIHVAGFPYFLANVQGLAEVHAVETVKLLVLRFQRHQTAGGILGLDHLFE